MWRKPSENLPDEEVLVTVQVQGEVRENYYRIGGRWYAMVDLGRWRMNTSPYWPTDKTWYVKTENIEAWHYQSHKKKGSRKSRMKRKSKIRKPR